MTTNNKLSDLSNDELLELLDKFSKESEDILQEIFKRQVEGRMEEFTNIDKWLSENPVKKLKKIS